MNKQTRVVESGHACIVYNTSCDATGPCFLLIQRKFRHIQATAKNSCNHLYDQRRLLFWKKMLSSNNVLLRILARLCQLKTVALAAKYGIFQLGSFSVRDVKCGIFSTFRNTVL